MGPKIWTPVPRVAAGFKGLGAGHGGNKFSKLGGDSIGKADRCLVPLDDIKR